MEEDVALHRLAETARNARRGHHGLEFLKGAVNADVQLRLVVAVKEELVFAGHFRDEEKRHARTVINLTRRVLKARALDNVPHVRLVGILWGSSQIRHSVAGNLQIQFTADPARSNSPRG